jgi:MFS family permease
LHILPSLAYRRYVLGLLAVTYTFNFTDRQILSILLQPIKQELMLTDTQLGLLSGIAFALFYVSLGVPIGRMADRKSRINIISASIFLWSLMTALSGLATNFWHLLLARIGVGVGEAGCTPPAHSLISDYFAAGDRSGAMGIYSLGVPVGAFLGILIGGWVAQWYGWRTAFFVVGLPGVLLAIVVRLTIKEPARGLADGKAPESDQPPPLKEVISLLWSKKCFRHITMGTSLLAAGGFAHGNWIPPFLIRSHGMGLGEIGTWLSLLTLVGGVIGVLAGGYLGDRLGRRSARWYCLLPGIMLLIAFPFSVSGLLVSSPYKALTIWLVPTIANALYFGPVMALIQRLVGVRIRATSVAIFLFFTNLIGMGGGPLLIGIISDFSARTFGDESLRYALLIGTLLGLWSAIHYLLAARTVIEDLRTTEGGDS